MRDLTTEEKVRKFYDTQGWEKNPSGNYVDTELWGDLRECTRDYVSACRRKILKHLPQSGDRILDAASGPVQYPEYLEYSAQFRKRVCVDISQKALEQAKARLGDKGEYFCLSILELPFSDDSFDAAISLFTIFHIDKDQQEAAVRQLIRVTKPNHPIVIIYANPDDFFSVPRFIRFVKRFIKRLMKGGRSSSADGYLYYYTYPLSWWKRFEDTCHVEIKSWRILTARYAKLLIPNNAFGKKLLTIVLGFENRFPKLSAKLGSYPMIILKKR